MNLYMVPARTYEFVHVVFVHVWDCVCSSPHVWNVHMALTRKYGCVYVVLVHVWACICSSPHVGACAWHYHARMCMGMPCSCMYGRVYVAHRIYGCVHGAIMRVYIRICRYHACMCVCMILLRMHSYATSTRAIACIYIYIYQHIWAWVWRDQTCRG